MKKLMSDPESFVEDVLDGILKAHQTDLVHVEDDKHAIVRADAPVTGKVAIVTGGGSGHLPLFLGYVGLGLAHGVAVGNVFSSPSFDTILRVTRAVDGGAGVLYIIGNYTGDKINFSLAAQEAARMGLRVETVVMTDDVASAPSNLASKRRGIAGLFFLYKICGALSEEGKPLGEVTEIGNEVIRRTRTMGVALSPCTLPTTGRATFEIGEDEMEIGMGIHGEPGTRRGKIERAERVAEILVESVINDLRPNNGERVAVLINGLGATPREELYIVFRSAVQALNEMGIEVFRTYVGEFATSLEMSGCSISVLSLNDDLVRLLDAPAYSPLLTPFYTVSSRRNHHGGTSGATCTKDH